MKRILGAALALAAAGLGFGSTPWDFGGSVTALRAQMRGAFNPAPDADTPRVTRSQSAPWHRDEGYRPKARRRSYKTAVQLCRRQQVGGPTPA